MALNDYAIAQAVQIASLLEAYAPKPGNISPGKSFKDLKYHHFLFSSAAVFPAFLDLENKKIGEIILEGVKETQSLIKTNTNLGIILLCAPLASAYQNLRDKKNIDQLSEEELLAELRKELHLKLTGLDKNDAKYTYRAINYSKAGNLDQVEDADLTQEPDINLYQAMKLAEKRDSIAFEYVSDFSIIFVYAYPLFKENNKKFKNIEDVIVQSYLEILAEFPDTLISRKHGFQKAAEISNQAAVLLKEIENDKKNRDKKLKEFDKNLRKQKNKINPGTTADLITAVIFLSILVSGKKIIRKWAD